ncbi:hypothetical protein G6F35_019066 [Rhizopus arrhizus]|nr:hypothetical protein G6F35_019066 [Rhizopus arrhizus]
MDAGTVRLPFRGGQCAAVVPAVGDLIQVHVLQARAVLAGAIGRYARHHASGARGGRRVAWQVRALRARHGSQPDRVQYVAGNLR